MNLERILSPIKKGLFAVGLTGVLALGSNKASAYDDYTYFTESSPISRNSSIQDPKSGYIGGSHFVAEGEIAVSSIGSYREEVKAPSESDVREQVLIRTKFGLRDEEEGKYRLEISYERRANERERREVEERRFVPSRAFVEETGLTSIYVALPKGVKIEKFIQQIGAINNRTGEDVELFAIPFDQTKTSKVLEVLNDLILEGDEKKKKEYINQMDRTLMNSIGLLPEGYQQITEKGYDLLKDFILMHKEKEVQEIAGILKGEFSLFEVPFYQAVKDPARYSSYGRESRLTLDTSKLEKEAKGFIFIPSIGYSRVINGSKEVATLRGLAYEFTLPANKAGGKTESR